VISWWDARRLREGHEIYQKTAESVAHPASPCKRLLGDARMGDGKTRVLITVLSQHFADPRKKLPIFPTKALAVNFYDELLRWPSPYRSYFALVQPSAAAIAARLPAEPLDQLRQKLEEVEMAEWKVPPEHANDLQQKLRVELEMTQVRRNTGERLGAINRGRITNTFRRWFESQFPNKLHLLPGAPLRAMNLSTAGGSFSAKKQTGEAKHPVAQFGYKLATKNVFDNAVVVIDEAHNLMTHASQCKLLRPQLMTASNMTLLCLTGTPVPDNPKVQLDALEAHLEKQQAELKGILLGWSPAVLRILTELAASSDLPIHSIAFLFGKMLAAKLPDKRCLEGFVCSYHGVLPGDSARIIGGSAAECCEKALASPVRLPAIMAARYVQKVREKKDNRVLQTYTNLEVAVSHIQQHKCEKRSLEAPEKYAAKFYSVIRQILASDLKTVVLVRRKTGYEFFLKLLRQLSSAEDVGIATLEDKASFNCRDTNLRGEKLRILVGETDEAGEGSSFFCVRQLYLLDVPSSATEFEQRKARVDRAGSHRGLPMEERAVNIYVICGALPAPLTDYFGSYVWQYACLTSGTDTPGNWIKKMEKVKKAVSAVHKLNVNGPRSLQQLAELAQVALRCCWQTRREDLPWMEERANASDDSSDDETVAAFDKAVNKLKQLSLTRQLGRVTNGSAQELSRLTKSLCVETVDQANCRSLAQRCQLVEAAHGKFKKVALDRSFFDSLQG